MYTELIQSLLRFLASKGHFKQTNKQKNSIYMSMNWSFKSLQNSIEGGALQVAGMNTL